MPLGERFAAIAEPDEQLASVEVIVGAYVERLKITFVNFNGKRRTLAVGRDSTKTGDPLAIRGELVAIQARTGWYVDAIRFLSSHSAESEWIGGPGGDSLTTIEIAQRDGVRQGTCVGLWGHADRQGIEAIGMVFWSVERTQL